jgi:hypothetical protein
MPINTPEVPERFGSDLGLVHQVVVAGRDVGMGHTEWSALADNKKLLMKVAATVHAALEISGEDVAAVEKWAVEVGPGIGATYEEKQSYDPRNTQCRYNEFYINYHRVLESLFWKAEHHNEGARDLCREIEALFVLAYAHSALYMAVHAPVFITFANNPLASFFLVFDAIYDDKDVILWGRFLTPDHFREIEGVDAVREEEDRLKKICRGENIKPETIDLGVVHNLCEACASARNRQQGKVLRMVAAIVRRCHSRAAA